MLKENRPVRRRTKAAMQKMADELLVYDVRRSQKLNEKSKKKVRVCLKCNTNLTNRNKCEKCGVKFHDGLLLRFIKRFCGMSPK